MKRIAAFIGALLLLALSFGAAAQLAQTGGGKPVGGGASGTSWDAGATWDSGALWDL